MKHDLLVIFAGLAFTRVNVLKVTGEITDLWGNREFAYRLKVPDQKKKEIQLKFPTIKEQREQLIIYWMDWDPRASWRGMIVTLDGLNKTKLADTIRGYAEPILGKLYAQQNGTLKGYTIEELHYINHSFQGSLIDKRLDIHLHHVISSLWVQALICTFCVEYMI